MPEYLAPGVYVEETSFRAKSIEGVSTSTAGFVGPARYGPVDGPPELITSFQEFERIFGGSDRFQYFRAEGRAHNYLAHGVRAFFDNGGKRVYVSRIYAPPALEEGGVALDATEQAQVDAGGRAFTEFQGLTVRARFPGSAGQCRVAFRFRVTRSVLATDGTAPPPDSPPGAEPQPINVLRGVNPDDLVWVTEGGSPPRGGTLFRAVRLFDELLGRSTWELHPAGGGAPELLQDLTAEGPEADTVHVVTASVEVTFVDPLGTILRQEAWDGLGFHPESRKSLTFRFATDLPSRTEELRTPIIIQAGDLDGPEIAEALIDQLLLIGGGSPPLDLDPLLLDNRRFEVSLSNGSDGVPPQPEHYIGPTVGDDPRRKTGLLSLEDVTDISIVAAPGYSAGGNAGPAAITRTQTISNALVSHAERMQYRIAVLDSADGQRLNDVRAQRSQLDSSHAALYFPWVRVLDPVTDQEIPLPPSGFVAGVYARNDVQHGVHKAPANEVVRGALGFEITLNKGQQDVLNPEGINCFRTLEGRGNRVWGARTISSDPEWKYVNLRRYFAYLERSIDRGTQWVVFENNGDTLWANVRRTVEDFLFNEWKQDHLLGEKPESAYFVKCDRTTMTQNDLDNGRLVCLIGVAPLRPAEFVIFRIGQWTGDRKV
ncbi:MAG TPA: phage tail sheath subtilisin-like domain-containing protein [Longimicrobiales bacterium]|nr:phage tail sheath subtilisin-like domain-containing protein [Longimicrobiales bacterium]